MAIKVVAYFSTLLHYAREQALAEASGDPERIEAATRKHESYKELCLREDVEMKIDSPEPMRLVI